MNPKLTIEALLAFEPCPEGREFIDDKTVKELWLTCPRADWMLWALEQFNLLDDKLVRKFSCDCAEHVLHFFEEQYPDDKRPRLAIEAGRRRITDRSEEAIAAAGAATRVATRVAGAAAGAAWAAVAAAWAAVRAATGNHAWDEARDAAGAAENKWQADRLRTLFNPFEEKP